jgi:hypothetical protein
LRCKNIQFQISRYLQNLPSPDREKWIDNAVFHSHNFAELKSDFGGLIYNDEPNPETKKAFDSETVQSGLADILHNYTTVSKKAKIIWHAPK